MKQGCTKKPVGDICKILNGFAFKSNEYVDDGVRVLRITNVQKGYIVDDDPHFFPIIREKEISKYMLYEGDLLMSLTGNVGRVGVLSEEFLPAALNQRVACLRIKESAGVNLKYLFHIFNSKTFEDDCIVNATGIAQKNMSTKWLENYLIPVPPIAEQQKIVTELDCLSGIIEKKKQQLKELDNLAQSIFYEMFGDPVENDKGWDVKKFGDVANSELGKMLDSKKNQGELYPYLCSANVQWNDVDCTQVKEMRFEEDELERYRVYKGDLLICEGGDTGRCAIWKSDNAIYYQNALHRVRFVDGLMLPIFCLYTMKCYKERGEIDKYSSGQTIKHLVKKVLLTIPLIVPPITLQQEFASKIESIEKQKELLAQSIKETETLFNSRMDYYFN